MKRILVLALAMVLLSVSLTSQASKSMNEMESASDSENPPEGYAYWPPTEKFCRLYEVFLTHPQMVTNPLLGLVDVDPDDCYIIEADSLFGTVTYYIEAA